MRMRSGLFRKTIAVLVALLICTGCVRKVQRPSTTLLPPVGPELRSFYDENIDGIMCLAEFLSPWRTVTGVAVERVSGGLRIREIAAKSPAELSGLRPGDVIVGLDGGPVPYPLKIDSPSDLKIKRGPRVLTVKISPAPMKANNALEVKISVEPFGGEKYILETVVTGIEMSAVRYKSRSERAGWMVSHWGKPFWEINSICLDKVKAENIALRFEYGFRAAGGGSYGETIDILSKKADISGLSGGALSLQDLLDSSTVLINGVKTGLVID